MAAATKPIEQTEPETKIYARIARDRVHPDPDQPRKTFDEGKLAELAESVKLHDVIVPIEVRPHPTKEGHFIITAGERRWRAAGLAGKADVPCVIEQRLLTATEVRERQILENSQREDVPPLEEAEAYQDLLKNHGYTMDLLITKTGKSKAHLYGRLKLLELAPGARKALESGKLAPAIAELIARIADVKLQEKATKDVLGQGDSYSYDLQPERLANGEQDAKFQPLSFRAAVQLLRRRYQTRFDLTRFDPLDKTLLPKVGSCDQCPHRSGNQPALPGITPAKSVDEDHCTNPTCFEAKVDATFKMKAELAKSKGLKVIEGDAAKKILDRYDGRVNYDANYADPKSELPYNIARPGSTATWSGLLGKKLEEVPRVLVQDPNTGAARELIVKDKAVEVLRQLGKIEKESKSSGDSAAEKKRREDKKKHKARRELRDATYRRFLDQVVAGAAKEPGGKEAALWRWIATSLSSMAVFRHGTDEMFCKRRELESIEEIPDLVETMKTAGEVRGLVVELLLSNISEVVIDEYAGRDEKDMLETAGKIFGASWEKAEAAAKEAAKAEDKADAAKDAKKPKKGGKKS